MIVFSEDDGSDEASEGECLDLASYMDSLGVHQMVLHGAYCSFEPDQAQYHTDQHERLGWLADRPLEAEQIAYLQWEYHHLHAQHCAAAGDEKPDVQRVQDFAAYFGTGDAPSMDEHRDGSGDASGHECVQHHKQLAQKWAMLCIAFYWSTMYIARWDQTTHVARMMQALGERKDDLLQDAHALFLTRDRDISCLSELMSSQDYWHAFGSRYSMDVSKIGLYQSAGGCALAAVACGACVWAMPLLWPSVLGTAGHWAMVGVAAASGAAMMGYDIRSQSEWSWVRVLCGALVLGILAASVGALSHVALLWLAATCAWSAGATAASGAGLTLFAMCGLGGLVGCVRGEKKISP